MLVRVFNQVQDISQVADELEKRIEDADTGNDSVWLYPDEEIIIEEGEEANEQNNR
tara:strand:- start:133 stop:300 length:168 start_codon:yes stop_codon:yes gene_type:complete